MALHSADLRLSICGQAGGIDDGLPSLLGELILADTLATRAPVGVTLSRIGGKRSAASAAAGIQWSQECRRSGLGLSSQRENW